MLHDNEFTPPPRSVRDIPLERTNGFTPAGGIETHELFDNWMRNIIEPARLARLQNEA
ncbi:MAG: hypothetical protein ABI395_02895 [Sphingobium sp.]